MCGGVEGEIETGHEKTFEGLEFFHVMHVGMVSQVCACMHVCVCVQQHVQLFATPWTILWNSPGQNTGVDSLSLFQGIFPTQGLNPGLPHCRWILYQLSRQGGPDSRE